jgi:hypothetical protein
MAFCSCTLLAVRLRYHIAGDASVHVYLHNAPLKPKLLLIGNGSETSASFELFQPTLTALRGLRTILPLILTCQSSQHLVPNGQIEFIGKLSIAFDTHLLSF